jgi:hypothetical protein
MSIRLQAWIRAVPVVTCFDPDRLVQQLEPGAQPDQCFAASG